MKIKLNETLHMSEFGRDPKVAGDVIDIPEGQANDLIKRGLAKAVGGAPRNKAEGASSRNKARSGSRRGR